MASCIRSRASPSAGPAAGSKTTLIPHTCVARRAPRSGSRLHALMPGCLPRSLWPLVQRLAGGEGWPPDDAAAADRFLWQAEREGLLPLLFDADDLPPVVAGRLEAHRAL